MLYALNSLYIHYDELQKAIFRLYKGERRPFNMQELQDLSRKNKISIATSMRIFSGLNAPRSGYTFKTASYDALLDQIVLTEQKIYAEQMYFWKQSEECWNNYEKQDFNDLFLESTGIDLTETN